MIKNVKSNQKEDVKVMKKYFLTTAALVSTLMLGACSNKEEIGINLPNGNEKFITSDVEDVTKQEVFNAMVADDGLTAILDLVDYDILSKEYEIDTTKIDTALETYHTLYTDEESFESFLTSQGFESEEELRQYLELNLYREAAARAAVSVTDEEIQAAYDEKYATEESEESEETDSEETESTEAEETKEIPTLDEVKDELKEELIQEKLTDEFIVSTLAAEREKAGFVLLNDYLEAQYKEVSSSYEEVKETSDSVVAKTNETEYTAEQLYQELVNAYGLSNGVSLVDTKILEKKFSVDEDAIKELIDEFKVQLGTNYYAFMQQYGLNTDEEIYDYFKLAQLQDAAFALEYPITDDQLQAAYEAYQAKLKARHILVEDEETAKEIIAKLDEAEDKEATFKELAAEYGTDSTASNGGDLGAFGEGEMVSEFEEGTKALEVNTYTKEPVKSQFGYHVIYRYDDARTFDEMKEELESELRSEEYTQLRLETILIKYRSEANFKFTDELLQKRYETIVKNIEESAAKEESETTEEAEATE